MGSSVSACLQQLCSNSSAVLPVGFYVVSTFLHMSPDASLADLLSAAKTHCSLPWSVVRTTLGDNINVERYCTWGPYISTLLTAGLGLQDDWVRIGSCDVAWPLGAALTEGSKIPELMHRRSSTKQTAVHHHATWVRWRWQTGWHVGLLLVAFVGWLAVVVWWPNSHSSGMGTRTYSQAVLPVVRVFRTSPGKSSLRTMTKP